MIQNIRQGFIKIDLCINNAYTQFATEIMYGNSLKTPLTVGLYVKKGQKWRVFSFFLQKKYLSGKAKFTRNAKTGSEQKGGLSRRRYHEYVAARAASSPPPASARAVSSATSRASISSPTKKEFKAALSRYVKELRRLNASNESQLKKNSSLKRKLVEKEETVKAATWQNSLNKSALKKAEKAKARVQVALNRKMAFRKEDALIAQAKAAATAAAFEKERQQFKAALKYQQE